MKATEELNALKKEYTELNKKLSALTEDDLEHVSEGKNTKKIRSVRLRSGI